MIGALKVVKVAAYVLSDMTLSMPLLELTKRAANELFAISPCIMSRTEKKIKKDQQTLSTGLQSIVFYEFPPFRSIAFWGMLLCMTLDFNRHNCFGLIGWLYCIVFYLYRRS